MTAPSSIVNEIEQSLTNLENCITNNQQPEPNRSATSATSLPSISELILKLAKLLNIEDKNGSNDAQNQNELKVESVETDKSTEYSTTYPESSHSQSIGSCTSYSKNLPTRQYEALCLGVGGIKGILQAGALHEFWTRKQLNSLTYYAGSSVGSIITSLLCIGYEPLDLLTALCAPDFSSQFGALNFMNLPNIYGLYPSSILRKKLEQMFLLKLGYLPTFTDLYHKMHKVLIIPVYCLSETDVKKRKLYCSYKTMPDMLIIDAIVLSCSIPVIFQKAIYRDKIYIDGAYTSCFPIAALQEIVPANCSILGLTLKQDELNLNSFLGYITSILTIPLQEQHSEYPVSNNIDIVELVPDPQISTVNFTLSPTQKMNLFSSGAKQIKTLLAKLDPLSAHSSSSIPGQTDQLSRPKHIKSDHRDKEKFE